MWENGFHGNSPKTVAPILPKSYPVIATVDIYHTCEYHEDRLKRLISRVGTDKRINRQTDIQTDRQTDEKSGVA